MQRPRRSKRGDPADDKAGWAGEGGYMKAKMRKLESQFAEETKKSSIFEGIRIYVNGYTDPPALEIRRLVQENGGTYVQYYSQSAGDFMVASNLPLSKIKKIGNKKVVKASWITDSIAAGQLLPWKNFELYPPKSQLKNQGVITDMFEKASDESEVKSAIDRPSPAKGDVENVESFVEDFEEDTNASSSLSKTDFDGHNQELSNEDFAVEFSTNDQKLHHDQADDGGGGGEVSALAETSDAILPTTSDAYIRQYYSRSRLHHLSKWASDLRDLVRSLRRQEADSDGARLFNDELQRISARGEAEDLVLESIGKQDSTPRILLHIDMDCFFVSVCLRSRPELVGQPVAVTHGKGTKSDASLSEVASCSYEARKFGVKNGMHLGRARKLCPELKTVPYEFDAFYRVAEDFYRTVAKFCIKIEAVSCDEMYVNVTSLLNPRPDPQNPSRVRLINPLHLGSLLRQHVQEATLCTATCGFGTNRLLARLATRRAKPDSQSLLLGAGWRCIDRSGVGDVCELAAPEGKRFLGELPLDQLPGVGRQMVRQMQMTYGISTCGELLQLVTQSQLAALLGAKTSQRIFQLCKGIDSSDLILDRFAKSISVEINYGVRLSSWSEVHKFVENLAKELSSRLEKAASESKSGFGMVGRSLSVHLLTRRPDQPVQTAKYLGHGVCDSFARTVNLPQTTADATVIEKACLSVLRRINPDPADIRGLGLQMQRLSPSDPAGTSQSHLKKSRSNKDQSPATPGPITRFLKPAGANQNEAKKDRKQQLEPIPESFEVCFDPETRDSLSAADDALSSFSDAENYLDDEPSRASTSKHVHHPTVNPGNLKTPEKSQQGRQTFSIEKTATTSTPVAVAPVRNVEDEEILPHQPNRPSAEVNVFAKRSLEELQNMFATWITTESDPLEEDLCMLADYLIQILPRNLYRVSLILRGLRRLIEGEDSVAPVGERDEWRRAFKRLKVTIDRACLRHYGAEELLLDDTDH